MEVRTDVALGILGVIPVWLGVVLLMLRCALRSEVVRMRLELRRWAKERGFAIVGLRRLPNVGFFHRLLFSRNSIWSLGASGDVFGRSGRSLTTLVMLRDQEGNIRRGRVECIARLLRPVEVRWEEFDAAKSELMTTQDEPLRDRWIDG